MWHIHINMPVNCIYIGTHRRRLCRYTAVHIYLYYYYFYMCGWEARWKIRRSNNDNE